MPGDRGDKGDDGGTGGQGGPGPTRGIEGKGSPGQNHINIITSDPNIRTEYGLGDETNDDNIRDKFVEYIADKIIKEIDTNSTN